MDRLTEPCGPSHFRVCGNKTVYNRKPSKSSRVSYALAKLFRLEEDQEPQSVRWIPVEERLPDSGKTVLVTRKCQNGKWYTEQDEYYEDTGFESGADEDIIAWRQMPEPYRPAE